MAVLVRTHTALHVQERSVAATCIEVPNGRLQPVATILTIFPSVRAHPLAKRQKRHRKPPTTRVPGTQSGPERRNRPLRMFHLLSLCSNLVSFWNKRRPHQSKRRPYCSNRRPSQSKRRPHWSKGSPDQSNRRPDCSIPVADWSTMRPHKSKGSLASATRRQTDETGPSVEHPKATTRRRLAWCHPDSESRATRLGTRRPKAAD